MHARTGWLAVIGLAAIFFGSDSWAVCYVNQNATGKNDGSSWNNAYTHPQFALLNSCSEIWVAKGVYTPSGAANDQSMTFDIPPATRMYGGFSGSETSVDQRKPTRNLTVLSGDVDRNDGHHDDDQIDRYNYDIVGENSWHVVTIESITSVAIAGQILDGFVITGGDSYSAHSSDSDAENGNGGGILCSTRGGGECRPMLSNLAITGNQAWFGGGIFVGLLNSTGSSKVNVSLSNSTLAGNNAAEGGAIFVEYDNFPSKSKFSNVSFVANRAEFEGGAVDDAGGNSIFSNCMFYENISGDDGGGALHFESKITPSTETLLNITFYENYSDDKGNAIHDLYGNLLLINTILWENRSSSGSEIYVDGSVVPTILDSVVQSGCPDIANCTGVSAENPLLSTVGSYKDFSLVLVPAPAGSAIDAGNDGACPSDDLRKVARPQGAHCDIGAIEWQPSDDIIFKNGFQ